MKQPGPPLCERRDHAGQDPGTYRLYRNSDRGGLEPSAATARRPGRTTTGDCLWHPATVQCVNGFRSFGEPTFSPRSSCLFVREQKDESLLRPRLARPLIPLEPFEKEVARYVHQCLQRSKLNLKLSKSFYLRT